MAEGEELWWYVHAGKNSKKHELYFGISQDYATRRDGSHCQGGKEALRHWNPDTDGVTWVVVSKHKTRAQAWETLRDLEDQKPPPSFSIIMTIGG